MTIPSPGRLPERKKVTATVTHLSVPTISTADALALVHHTYKRFTVMPSEAAYDATALWVAHTHVFNAFFATPRLYVSSREKGSGKTRVLELAEHMTPNGKLSVNITPSVVWRLLGAGEVTLLIDECDILFKINGSSTANAVLRAIINVGYRKGGAVDRATGSQDVTSYKVFGPIALAGIGRLPDTIADRSVHIPMRKRSGNEHVDPFELDDEIDDLHRIRDALASWGRENHKALSRTRPSVPVQNRPAEIWRPLVAIADHAGGEWPERARTACVQLSAQSTELPIGLACLADTRRVFCGERMTSAQLVKALIALRGAWTEGNLSPARLARHLAEFDVTPGTVRLGAVTAKGYQRKALAVAWAAYLPAVTP